MIEIGESPNGGNINKFLSTIAHEGLRGWLLATNEDKTEGIMLSGNTSLDGQCKWGHLYQVKEVDPEQYPEIVKQVDSIPTGFKTVF